MGVEKKRGAPKKKKSMRARNIGPRFRRQLSAFRYPIQRFAHA